MPNCPIPFGSIEIHDKETTFNLKFHSELVVSINDLLFFVFCKNVILTLKPNCKKRQLFAQINYFFAAEFSEHSYCFSATENVHFILSVLKMFISNSTSRLFDLVIFFNLTMSVVYQGNYS